MLHGTPQRASRVAIIQQDFLKELDPKHSYGATKQLRMIASEISPASPLVRVHLRDFPEELTQPLDFRVRMTAKRFQPIRVLL